MTERHHWRACTLDIKALKRCWVQHYHVKQGKSYYWRGWRNQTGGQQRLKWCSTTGQQRAGRQRWQAEQGNSNGLKPREPDHSDNLELQEPATASRKTAVTTWNAMNKTTVSSNSKTLRWQQAGSQCRCTYRRMHCCQQQTGINLMVPASLYYFVTIVSKCKWWWYLHPCQQKVHAREGSPQEDRIEVTYHQECILDYISHTVNVCVNAVYIIEALDGVNSQHQYFCWNKASV